MRTIKLIPLVMAAVLALAAVGAISAEEKLATDDGRVNYWDASATAAVYCDFANLDAQDGEKGDFTGIEVLHINPANGNGEFALRADIDEMDAVGVSTAEDLLITEENDYQLWRTTDGGFRVNGPSFFNFEWDRSDLYC